MYLHVALTAAVAADTLTAALSGIGSFAALDATSEAVVRAPTDVPECLLKSKKSADTLQIDPSSMHAGKIKCTTTTILPKPVAAVPCMGVAHQGVEEVRPESSSALTAAVAADILTTALSGIGSFAALDATSEAVVRAPTDVPECLLKSKKSAC
jgi:hypothetical protein